MVGWIHTFGFSLSCPFFHGQSLPWIGAHPHAGFPRKTLQNYYRVMFYRPDALADTQAGVSSIDSDTTNIVQTRQSKIWWKLTFGLHEMQIPRSCRGRLCRPSAADASADDEELGAVDWLPTCKPHVLLSYITSVNNSLHTHTHTAML